MLLKENSVYLKSHFFVWYSYRFLDTEVNLNYSFWRKKVSNKHVVNNYFSFPENYTSKMKVIIPSLGYYL